MKNIFCRYHCYTKFRWYIHVMMLELSSLVVAIVYCLVSLYMNCIIIIRHTIVFFLVPIYSFNIIDKGTWGRLMQQINISQSLIRLLSKQFHRL